MSFHGVPERTLQLGDPYHCECHKTARLLAERLGLAKDRYKVTFQSRLGRAKWLEPYTEPTLVALALPASGGWMSSARASPATAWRRSKKSPWKPARVPECRRQGISATSPA